MKKWEAAALGIGGECGKAGRPGEGKAMLSGWVGEQVGENATRKVGQGPEGREPGLHA